MLAAFVFAVITTVSSLTSASAPVHERSTEPGVDLTRGAFFGARLLRSRTKSASV